MDLTKEIESLPLHLQKELEEFLSFLKFKAQQQSLSSTHSTSQNNKKNDVWKAGMWKGKIKVADDFDEPLSDFNDYM